jgi:hypothetical protein
MKKKGITNHFSTREDIRSSDAGGDIAPMNAQRYSTPNQIQGIRQASNVVQALENLIVQCGDEIAFEFVSVQALEALSVCKNILLENIHRQ